VIDAVEAAQQDVPRPDMRHAIEHSGLATDEQIGRMKRAGMIPVDRGGGKPALAAMAAHVRDALAAGKQIIIFPEGTRRPAGAEPKYKYGIAHLYGEGIAACVPIALNSGLFWPRRQFLRYPGTITVEILDPIAPGLPIDEFFERLQRDLEAATARLIAQGRRDIAAAGARSAAV